MLSRALLGCLIPVAGCHLIFAFDPSSGRDAPSLQDAGIPLLDGQTDGRSWQDGPTQDLLLPAGDAGQDAGPVIDTTDPADGSVGPDQATIWVPCAPSATVKVIYQSPSTGSPMVICEGNSGPINQNQANGAASPCNTTFGWHLCDTVEFRARGGTTTPVQEDAWIKGAAVNSGASYYLADQTCDGFDTPMQQGTVAYPCGSGPVITDNSDCWAIRASGACHRIADDSPSNEAYWTPVDPLSIVQPPAIDRAVCCW